MEAALNPEQLIFDLTDPTLTTDLLRLHIMRAKDEQVHGICVLPGRVRNAGLMATRSSLEVRTLVGYPAGVHTASVKGLETRLALQDGAGHIAMTPNVGYFLGGQREELAQEIAYVAKALREVAPERARTLAVVVDLKLVPFDQVGAYVAAIIDAGGRGLHLVAAAETTPAQIRTLLQRFTTRSTSASVALQLRTGHESVAVAAWLATGIDYLLIPPPFDHR